MAAKIEQQFPIQVELIPSSGGVFEIIANETLLYSKKATGEFPSEQTVMEMLRSI